VKKLLLLSLCLGLAACGDQNDDLRQFVRDAGKDMKGKVEPLPQVKPYTPFSYDAFDIPDPFKPRKLKPTGKGGGLQPDVNRPRELLENFPLENLKMVGSLEQREPNKKAPVFYGLIKTPDNNIYRVKVGNYLGQNYGKIMAITETEITLKETVEDAGGNWTERETSMTLQEQ
jgi:type IV pilus assembly protein PilP